MLVFLADLGHNQMTLSSDIYPIGIANCAAYAREHLKTRKPLEYRLFREPEDLARALRTETPAVLAVSSYAWNHRLSTHFLRAAKQIHPRLITMMGGPNYPLTEGEMASWMASMPECDIAVRGPTYEGERAFVAMLQRLVDTGFDLTEARSDSVSGNDWIDPRDGRFVRGAELPRIRDLDEIPSPYLTGLMDPYYQTGYFPMMQIARGCPFTCQYCNSAPVSNSKVFAHSIENVKADLLHIAKRVKPETPLCFADDNFGMFEREEEIADYIAHLQDQFGWPKYIRTTTGKNKGERIIRVMRKIRGALPMTSAVQSLNPEVLKNIQRNNINLETYAEIQRELHEQGMQSYGELILSMPGETRETFMDSVRKLLATGVDRISAHQLMLLHGAPLSNPDQRARFGFKTKFRVVARNLGNYTGEPVVETEEMVIATPTFSEEDYYTTRVFHLLLTIYYYEGNFAEAFALAGEHGVLPVDIVTEMQARLTRAPAAFRRLIDDFRAESEQELFDSAEACLAWAKHNFAGLASGDIGGNLLSKYSMLGRFFVWSDALTFLGDTIDELLHGDASSELRSVMDYLRGVMLHAPFSASLAQAPEWRSEFDVAAWYRNPAKQPLASFRFESPRNLCTFVPEEVRASLMRRVEAFGEHPAGLGKFTRTLFARDLRRATRVG